jgi:hypothetical protein
MTEASRQKSRPPDFRTPPRAAEHSRELLVVGREMQHGAADHRVREGIREGHALDRLGAKVGRRKLRGETRRQPLHGGNRIDIQVDRKHLVASSEQVDEVAPRTAARVEDPHRRRQASTQQLVEEVDVDLAKLRFKVSHRAHPTSDDDLTARSRAYSRFS